MTCSAEQLALYVGGDLSPSESGSLKAHLAECVECQALLKGLRADSIRLQAFEPTLTAQPMPKARRGAPLRWASVAALVLLLASTVPAIGAMEGVFRLFPFLTVKEMPAAEYAALLAAKQPTGPLIAPEPVESVEAAEAAIGRPVARIGWLPPGFGPDEVLVSDLDEVRTSSVQQTFAHTELDLHLNLYQSSPNSRFEAVTQAGTTREVQIKGEPAAIVTRSYENGMTSRDLYFQWKGHPMTLSLFGPAGETERLPDELLISVAESLS